MKRGYLLGNKNDVNIQKYGKIQNLQEVSFSGYSK